MWRRVWDDEDCQGLVNHRRFKLGLAGLGDAYGQDGFMERHQDDFSFHAGC